MFKDISKKESDPNPVYSPDINNLVATSQRRVVVVRFYQFFMNIKQLHFELYLLKGDLSIQFD